jgi:alanine dehydrogenase
MVIGILKEDTTQEQRVALSPAGVQPLVAAGHAVYVQQQAGALAHFYDERYQTAGASIAYSAEEIINRSDVILKVASPSEEELRFLTEGQVFLSFLHLTSAKRKTIEALLERKVTAIAYELIENARGDLAVLQSMSEIAGQVAIQVAAHYLQAREGGRGILLGSVPGVPPASVLVLGAGTVGRTAARIAVGMGANVTVLDRDIARLRELESLFQWRIATGTVTSYNIARAIKHADVVIGAVLLKGERTPHLVTEDMVKGMKAGSVILDVSIDQGGCVETSRPTTFEEPVFVRHGVVHYCVPNMTTSVARTATVALTNALQPYLHAITDLGVEQALRTDRGLAKGVCTFDGDCTNEAIAAALGIRPVSLSRHIGSRLEPSKN